MYPEDYLQRANVSTSFDGSERPFNTASNRRSTPKAGESIALFRLLSQRRDRRCIPKLTSGRRPFATPSTAFRGSGFGFTTTRTTKPVGAQITRWITLSQKRKGALCARYSRGEWKEDGRRMCPTPVSRAQNARMSLLYLCFQASTLSTLSTCRRCSERAYRDACHLRGALQTDTRRPRCSV